MRNCEKCGFKHWIKPRKKDNRWVEIKVGEDMVWVRQWLCANRDCSHLQTEEKPYIERRPRILYYDIETSKMTLEVKTFGLKMYNPYLHWEDIKKPPFLICWSAAWIPTDDYDVRHIRPMTGRVTGTEAKRRNDKRCVKELWELMDEADFLVGHNVKAFDTKKVHTRFILNKLPAPDLSVKQIDTLSIARKYFKNDSNTLGYWLERFGKAPKDDMKGEDWDLCEAGDEKTLRKMQKYNKRDVIGGIELFLEFKQYIESGGGRLYKW